MSLKDIPVQKTKDDSHFYNPLRQLIQAVEQYYKREQGISPSLKQVENQIVKMIRRYDD